MRVGAIELRLLEHCSKTGATTIREAADSFGQEHGIGLTTVQKMMERLRKKNLLKRDKVEGVWVYQTVESRETMLKGVVKDFIERTLGGSLEPFMLYLADKSSITKEELDEVKEIVDKLSEDAEDGHR